ncbi:MAG TPA: hypothetical protein VGF14_05360 [Alphaproteobacteria bacterium]
MDTQDVSHIIFETFLRNAKMSDNAQAQRISMIAAEIIAITSGLVAQTLLAPSLQTQTIIASLKRAQSETNTDRMFHPTWHANKQGHSENAFIDGVLTIQEPEAIDTARQAMHSVLEQSTFMQMASQLKKTNELVYREDSAPNNRDAALKTFAQDFPAVSKNNDLWNAIWNKLNNGGYTLDIPTPDMTQAAFFLLQDRIRINTRKTDMMIALFPEEIILSGPLFDKNMERLKNTAYFKENRFSLMTKRIEGTTPYEERFSLYSREDDKPYYVIS